MSSSWVEPLEGEGNGKKHDWRSDKEPMRRKSRYLSVEIRERKVADIEMWEESMVEGDMSNLGLLEWANGRRLPRTASTPDW